MEAIILAGGLGTRLRAAISDVPKPMAPIEGKPFLQYLVDYIIKQGVSHIVFSVGYKGDMIIDYFKENPCGVEVSFAVEEEALGTGGAIVNGLKKCHSDRILVLNGDTFLALDYQAFTKNHEKSGSSLSMALRYLEENDRYGRAILKDQHIIGFESANLAESENGAGWINAGVYLIDKNLLTGFNMPEKFSFEQAFVEAHIEKVNPAGFKSDAAFIDIGVPNDYYRTADFLKKIEGLS